MMTDNKLLILFISLVILSVWLINKQGSNQPAEYFSSFDESLAAEDNQGFERVYQPRRFVFPEDFGSHDNFRLEWWYFTGNIQNRQGRKFGYELTFFRFALAPEKTPFISKWRSRQLYMAHFALTDVKAEKFYSDERVSRAARGLAGAKQDSYHVWLYDWSAAAVGREGFPLRLQANNSDTAIDLILTPEKPLMPQGRDGLSQKSQEPGNASYYYSATRLATIETIRVKNQRFSVTGNSWMDREWSTSALAPEQQGWDWFALQLSDGSELMFYQFRRKDGLLNSNSAGAIFPVDGRKKPLTAKDVQISVLDTWKSPHSVVSYPSGWAISVAGQKLKLKVIPLLNDQELNLRYRYWEGAVSVSGMSNAKPVTGQGYVELTGYSKK